MAKQTPLEKQLAELDQLHQRGVITEQEHAARRMTLLTSAPPASAKGRSVLKTGCLAVAGILGVLVLLIVMGTCLTSGRKDSDSASNSAGTPGQAGTNKGDVHVALAEGASGEIFPERNENKRVRVTLTKIADNARSANQFSTPPAGKKYWAVQVTIENVGTAETSLSDWKLRDSKNQELTQTFVSGIGESPNGGSLTPGGKTSGWIIFQMDADATVKWLRADPNPFLKNDLYFDAPAQ